MSKPSKVLRVGIIGCGEITQVAHIPTLGFLSDYYRVTFLCDISDASLQHCKSRVSGTIPHTTADAATLCASPDVDVVFVTNATEYHVPHAILALQNNKFVFVEKPMAMCHSDADALIEAEKKSKGKVFVGYMRRYAPAFLDAVRELGGLENILYARVRGLSTLI
jgi:predicted dehydrogenase